MIMNKKLSIIYVDEIFKFKTLNLKNKRPRITPSKTKERERKGRKGLHSLQLSSSGFTASSSVLADLMPSVGLRLQCMHVYHILHTRAHILSNMHTHVPT